MVKEYFGISEGNEEYHLTRFERFVGVIYNIISNTYKKIKDNLTETQELGKGLEKEVIDDSDKLKNAKRQLQDNIMSGEYRY